MPDRFIVPQPRSGPFVLGPGSQRRAEVPKGTVTKAEFRSEVFPGTVRDYWVYVPAQYAAAEVASVMVFQDGGSYIDEAGEARATIVMDNLIHDGKMPVTIGVFVDPGRFPPAAAGRDPVSNRSLEYDSLNGQYARFLLEEILPLVGATHRLTQEAGGRGICGASSGGICAFNAAWERPDAFGKVLSHVGSFANIRGGHVYPALVRSAPPKPIRVFLQAGSNDLDRPEWGNWPLANLQMAAALQAKGYDYRLDYGDGEHNLKHAGAILPESLAWLWR